MGIFICLITIILVGHFILCRFYSSIGIFNRYECYIFSFLISTSYTSLISFALTLIGNSFFNAIYQISIVMLLVLIYMLRTKKYFFKKAVYLKCTAKKNHFIGISYLIIFFFFLTVFSLSIGIYAKPEYSIWAFKGKLLYFFPYSPLDHILDDNATFSHYSYPLYLPSIIAWVHTVFDSNTILIKTLPPFFSIILCILFYYEIRRINFCNNFAILLTIIMSNCIVFISCSYTIYADIIFSVFIFSGNSFLLRYLENQNDKTQLYIGFLLIAGSAWVKNEGLLFFATSTTLIYPFLDNNLNLKGKVCLIFKVILFCSPFIFFWPITRLIMDVHVNDFNTNNLLNWSSHIAKFQLILQSFLKNMFLSPFKTGLAWIFLTFILFTRFKLIFKSSKCRYLLLNIGAVLLVYFFIFFLSTREIEWHLVSVGRILIAPSLLAYWIFAFSLKKTFLKPSLLPNKNLL